MCVGAVVLGGVTRLTESGTHQCKFNPERGEHNVVTEVTYAPAVFFGFLLKVE